MDYLSFTRLTLLSRPPMSCSNNDTRTTSAQEEGWIFILEKNGTNEPLSLKEVFQGMITEPMAIIKGKVIFENPLKIQAINDDKLIIEKNIMSLPRHLTTYKTTVDVSLNSGIIDIITKSGQGNHAHGKSGEHSGHELSDGAHNHPDNEGEHVHNIETFTIKGASMTVYNELKLGEIVYILSYNQGKKYYILDREA